MANMMFFCPLVVFGLFMMSTNSPADAQITVSAGISGSLGGDLRAYLTAHPGINPILSNFAESVLLYLGALQTLLNNEIPLVNIILGGEGAQFFRLFLNSTQSRLDQLTTALGPYTPAPPY